MRVTGRGIAGLPALWAADDLRSVNTQVEWLLREAVRRQRGKRIKAVGRAHGDS
ncbi:MAG: hypothetical protein WBQ14_08855 [Gaiellaceae bacterium]